MISMLRAPEFTSLNLFISCNQGLRFRFSGRRGSVLSIAIPFYGLVSTGRAILRFCRLFISTLRCLLRRQTGVDFHKQSRRRNLNYSCEPTGFRVSTWQLRPSCVLRSSSWPKILFGLFGPFLFCSAASRVLRGFVLSCFSFLSD